MHTEGHVGSESTAAKPVGSPSYLDDGKTRRIDLHLKIKNQIETLNWR